MRTKHPPLLPIFRSRLQGELLACVLLTHGDDSSISELSRRIGADPATVQREADRLERAGIFSSRRVGRARLVSANRDSPLHRSLLELVLLTFGPTYVLRIELTKVSGVEEAYIFGSWAERYRGVEGLPPGDIDVLIVGNPDRDELHDATLRAEERLRREVSVAVRSPKAWANGNDSFTRQLRKSALVPVIEPKD